MATCARVMPGLRLSIISWVMTLPCCTVILCTLGIPSLGILNFGIFGMDVAHPADSTAAAMSMATARSVIGSIPRKRIEW